MQHGTFFEPALGIRSPEGDRFATEVLEIVSEAEQRTRKRTPLAEANFRTIILKILANGFRCHFHRQPSWVSYWRKADAYQNKPTWLSGRAMSRAIDALVGVGLVLNKLGERGAASTYRVSLELIDMAQRHGVTEHTLTYRLPPEATVRLRQPVTKAPAAFGLTDEIVGWMALLEAQNAFLAQHDIGLVVTADQEEDWTRHLNSEKPYGSPIYTRPERFSTDLHRTFNNGTFENGGRLYGGWWINTPAAMRRNIVINGRPTVELDFSGCAIRMLYHERFIDYRSDPYHLDAIAAYETEKRLAPGHFREGVKAITQALINDTGGAFPERIPLPAKVSFAPRFKRVDVRKMIEERHLPIADAFGSGAGLRLQRRDSDLALDILTELRKQEIVALPVHDSFITADVNEAAMYKQMTRSYKAAFGFTPIIDRK